MNPIKCVLIAGLAVGVQIAIATGAESARIAIVLKGQTPFWHEIQKGAEASAKAAGVEVLVKAPPTEDSVALQVRLVEALAATPPQVLVIAPDDKAALAPSVSALAKKGVKVIAVDSPLDSPDVRSFVGTDHRAAGAAAGKLLASLVKETDAVAIFRASETQTGGATEEREASAMNELKNAHASLTMHAEFRAGGNPEVARERAKTLLAKYPQVAAILASSTTGSLEMLHALQQTKRAGSIRFVGFGYNLPREIAQAIEAGAVTAWIAQLPQGVGAKAVETAVAVASGKDVPAIVHTDFLVITKDNLTSPEVSALVFD